MRYFLSSGEASGDAYAAELSRKLYRLDPDAALEGIGGKRFAQTGAKVIADTSAWGAISIAQSAKVVGRVMRGYRKASVALAKDRPGVFVPIDFGFVNLRLCRIARHLGWKVVYFLPPGSWRRDRQGKDLPSLCDAIVTQFPWSAEILNSMGATAHFFGHPLKEMIGQDRDERADGIAVLPGSRKGEIDLHLPLLADALGELPTAEFAVSPTVGRNALRKKWSALSEREDVFTEGDTYGVLQRARVAAVCSGTATLEAALCRCPMVVLYRVSRMTALEVKLLRIKFDYVSLPNIILQRSAVPELLHKDATPELLRKHLQELLEEGVARQRQLDAFEELDSLLGPNDAISRTAELLADIAKKP